MKNLLSTKDADGLAGRLRLHNAGRDPLRLAMKYALMRKSPFAFFRGSCRLFYEGLGPLPDSPTVWACGDLHIQNYGAYKGENRLVYFDVNDFDESCLMPANAEMARMLVSILLALDDGETLCRVFLDAYFSALKKGKAMWIEREMSSGMVRDLFKKLESRSRADLLDARTRRENGVRRIRIDGKKALKLEEGEDDKVRAIVDSLNGGEFYRVLDAARRIAGTGSLGLERYVVLVEGKGSPDGNYLLDLKKAFPSAPRQVYATQRQPAWVSEAHRIVTIQKRFQAVSQAMLEPVEFGGESFVLRELQPGEDKIESGNDGDRPKQHADLMVQMASVLAWNQLRSSARQGSANADELAAFAESNSAGAGIGAGIGAEMLKIAKDQAELAQRQWRAFGKSFDAGAFAEVPESPAQTRKMP